MAKIGAFLVKSPAWRFQGEAEDVAKIGSRKAFLVKSLA